LNKTRTERDDAQREVAAFRASGLTPEQALNAAKQIKGLQIPWPVPRRKTPFLGKRIKNWMLIWPFIATQVRPLNYRPQSKAKSWCLIPSGIYRDQCRRGSGVVEHGELLVNRDGKLVAKVIVSSVQKDRCVANVMNGWQLGEIYEETW